MSHSVSISLSDLKPSCIERMLTQAWAQNSDRKEPRKLFRGQKAVAGDDDDDADDVDVDEEEEEEEDENAKLVNLSEENRGSSNPPEATEDDFEEGLVRKTMSSKKVQMPKVVTRGKVPK